MKRATLRVGLLAALTGTLVMAAATAVASTDHGNAAKRFALVRAAHFSPDTAGVDVYLTGFSGKTTRLWLSNVGYGDVSDYRRLAPGAYTVALRPHNAPASTPAAFKWVLNVHAGQVYTTAAIGTNHQLHTILLHDTLNPPKQGTGLVRVIQAASRAPHATLTAVNGPTITRDLAFGHATHYVAVPARSWTIEARSTGKPAVAARAKVRVASGTISTIVLLDGKSGGLALRTVLDAAGAGQMPGGGVPAGGGGTAQPVRSHIGWLGTALSFALLVCGCSVIAWRRTGRQTNL
jgi:hypothetical protein